MKSKILDKRSFLMGVVSTILLMLFGNFSADWFGNCESPTVFYQYKTPADELRAFADSQDGLPKQTAYATADLTSPVISPPEYQQIQTIVTEDVRVRRSGSLWRALADNDQTFSISANFSITYKDGSTAQFSWNSWRYGYVFCPYAWSGDGPPGQIQLISTWRFD